MMDTNVHIDIDKERQKCKDDFFYFINMILIPLCPGGEFKYSNAEHFHQMFRLLLAEENFTLSDFGEYHLATENPYHNRKLGLLPRYHGKSRIGTIAYSMWKLFKNPDLRILIISETWDNARDMLKMIKDLYFEISMCRDTDMHYIWEIMGDWEQKGSWTQDKITVAPRVRKGTDPSIMTAGIEKEVTSKHFDLVICDDLLGETNTKTKEQLKKSVQHFSSLTEVGDIDSNMITEYIIWGTTWDYGDLYALILNKMKSRYDILKLRCWDDATNEKPTKTLFPEKFPLEFLKQVYKDKMMLGDAEGFYKQYLNDPLPRTTQIFKQDYIQFFEFSEVEYRKLTVVITVDPALSENEWSDYTAIVATGIDQQGRRYVLDYYKFQESDPAQVVANIIRMAKRYWQNKTHTLYTVGIERGALKNTLEPHLQKFASWMPYDALEHMNQSKAHRIINSLQPFVATKRLFIQRWMADLFDQMVRFPKSNVERDVLDALAYHVQLVPVWENPSEFHEPIPTTDKMFWEKVGVKVEHPQPQEIALP